MNEDQDIVDKYGYQDEELIANGDRSSESAKVVKTMMACLAMVALGAVGYALWNYDPPKQWDVTEQAASWWKDFSNRERKFPRKPAWDRDNIPVIDTPHVEIEIYDY